MKIICVTISQQPTEAWRQIINNNSDYVAEVLVQFQFSIQYYKKYSPSDIISVHWILCLYTLHTKELYQIGRPQNLLHPTYFIVSCGPLCNLWHNLKSILRIVLSCSYVENLRFPILIIFLSSLLNIDLGIPKYVLSQKFIVSFHNVCINIWKLWVMECIIHTNI